MLLICASYNFNETEVENSATRKDSFTLRIEQNS